MSNANEDARQHDAEEEDSQTSDVPWLDNGPGHLAQATIRVPRTTKSDYNNLEWHCHPDTAPRVVTAARLVAPWTDVKLGHGHGRPGWKDLGGTSARAARSRRRRLTLNAKLSLRVGHDIREIEPFVDRRTHQDHP
jgi:hypothetical protein